MTIAEVIKDYRLVDLSKIMVPGQATGPVGTGKRRLEIRKFNYPPGEIMHEIDMESHIGTHVEAPCHYVDARYNKKGKDISQIPLESLFGEAVLVDLKGFKPKQAVTPTDFEDRHVRKGDIVLIGNAPYDGEARPYLAKEAAQWLSENKVKMVGIDDSVFPEEPQYLFKSLENYYTHDYLSGNEIPFIEGLANLKDLPGGRFYFFGLVAPIARLEAFPIRAVAFVPKGA